MTDSGSRLERAMEIQNRLGLHARAAAKFVKVASKYECSVQISKDDIVVDGKSIMGVLMLAAAMGSKITVIAQGGDAEAALDELQELIDGKFGEE